MESIYTQLDDNDSEYSNSQALSGSLPVAATDGIGGPPPLDSKQLALWRWANVTNVDAFLADVYEFYLEKGIYCILLKRTLNMLTVLFVVGFSTFLTNCIDYRHLQGAKVLVDIKVEHCIAKSSFFTKLWLWIFGVMWLLRLFQYARDVPHLLELEAFYKHLLDINDTELQTINWQQVTARIVQLQDMDFKANNGGTVLLDPHNIANRIMRRENYMVALYSKDILDLNINLPWFGPTQFFTKTLEWSINLCVLDFVFNDRGTVRSIFMDEGKREVLARGLRHRFRFIALMNIVLAPFAILYMSLYYFFKYFNEYHKDPSTMGMRQYTPLAEWKLRELNELYHMFKRRLLMSTAPAERYISQFPREKTDIFLRFVVFIFSSFAAVLGGLSIYDPELLGLELSPEKSVLFFIGIFGTIIAVARGMSDTNLMVYEPETAMRQIIEFTHYFPDSWQHELHTEKVKLEFCSLYDLKIKVLLRDFLGIFLNPLLLWYNLPDNCEDIIDFFRENTTHVDGLGMVCNFAVFNFDQAQKVKVRADELDRYYASNDGKMLKSYLNFMDVYSPTGPITSAAPRFDCQSMEQSIMGKYSKLRRLDMVEEQDEHSEQSDGSEPEGFFETAPGGAYTQRKDPPDIDPLPARTDSHGPPPSPKHHSLAARDLRGSQSSNEESHGDLLHLLRESNQSSEIDTSNSGVFGLLNKISKTDGRRGPLR